MAQVVANTSKAYGYNYASLSDIANQGYEIPKMKTGTEYEREYVYYFDKEINEWVRGAEIVIPEMKGSNQAQKYGSALTYARRYTVLMALGLCCDDDKKVETTNKSVFDENIKTDDKKHNDLVDEMKKLYQAKDLKNICDLYQINDISHLDNEKLEKYINFKKYGDK